MVPIHQFRKIYSVPSSYNICNATVFASNWASSRTRTNLYWCKSVLIIFVYIETTNFFMDKHVFDLGIEILFVGKWLSGSFLGSKLWWKWKWGAIVGRNIQFPHSKTNGFYWREILIVQTGWNRASVRCSCQTVSQYFNCKFPAFHLIFFWQCFNLDLYSKYKLFFFLNSNRTNCMIKKITGALYTTRFITTNTKNPLGTRNKLQFLSKSIRMSMKQKIPMMMWVNSSFCCTSKPVS